MLWRSGTLASAAGPLRPDKGTCMPLHGASTLLLLAVYVVCTAAIENSTAYSTAYVSQKSEAGSRTLLSALQDNSIKHIIVQEPEYNVRPEFELYQGKPLDLNRNVTISGADGLSNILNLDFVASAVQLCPTCQLTFTNITVANERHGTGHAVDFVLGGANSSASVVLMNSNELRLVCSAGADAAASLQESERSSMLARQQQQVELLDVSYKGNQFPGSVHMIDVALAVPHEAVEGWAGGSGGYTLIVKNVSRLCYDTVDHACLLKGTPEACITAQMDEVRAAAVQNNSAHTVGKTVGVAVGVSAAALILIGAIIGLAWLRKRRRSNTQSGGKPSHSRTGSASDQQKMSRASSGGLAGCGYDDDLGQAGAINMDQLRMFDSFIEGCNFVRAPLGVRKGWEVSKVLTSPSAENAPGSGRKDIQLGQFLGAGSFGRVYRANWGGREVAVKVIEHNSDASSAVEGEVELMFKFSNHPNIVRAFYAITYTQQSNPTVPNGSSSSLNIVRDATGFPLNSSGGSSSNRVGIASNESGQRAALARLRGLPLQEIVIEDGNESSAADASGSSTPERTDVPVTRARLPPLQRMDSDDQQHQTAHAIPGIAAPARDHNQSSASGFAGSSITVRGSSLESTDCVSRVYSWMGSSGMGPVMGGTFNSGKKPSDGSEALKQLRAETWLVQEFCDRGTLGGIVAEWNPADENDQRMLQRLLLLKDSARGLKVLHSMNTVHGDLTARNVLVSSSTDAPYGMVAKLADLGLSRVIKLHATHRTTNTVGTLSHMPPELLRHGHCSTAVDIYAFGVMMWELYTNKAAFNKLQYGQFYETVVLRNLRPLVPAGMPADYSLLMQHCWASDPMQRPNVDRVIQCLSLMIAERQGRLSELQDTAAARVKSAPLPALQHPSPGATPSRAGLSFSGKQQQMLVETHGGVFRHRSCPGPGGALRLLNDGRAAGPQQLQQQQAQDEMDKSDAVGVWKGPPSMFQWSEHSAGFVCSTPSGPLRPPLLRRYVSDDYGVDLAPQEETWVV